MKQKLDYIYSILAAVLPLIIIQILLIPLYSNYISQKELGVFIMIMTFVNMSAVILGNSLNNIRLTLKEKITNENAFTSFLINLAFLQVLLNSAACYYLQINKLDSLFIIIWSVALLLKSYYLVYYRLNINYQKYLISSIINGIILLIGTLFLIFVNLNIYFIFGLAEIITIMFILIDIKEKNIKFNYSKLNKKTINHYNMLVITNLINNLILYSDRMLIGIFIGVKYTPLFFIATTVGKMSNIIISPITNVLLTYEVNRTEEKIKNKKMFANLIKLIVIVIFINIIVYYISLIFIKYFYSEYFSEVKEYIFLGNLAILLIASTSFPQMKLLAQNRYKQNLFINICCFLFILVTGIPLILKFGIQGFSIGLILSSLLKHIIIINLSTKMNYSRS